MNNELLGFYNLFLSKKSSKKKPLKTLIIIQIFCQPINLFVNNSIRRLITIDLFMNFIMLIIRLCKIQFIVTKFITIQKKTD